MAQDGWIKLHRKMVENCIFYKADYYQIWSYILLKVNHKDNEFIWNNEKKIIKKGSGIFSQKEMASDFKFGISKVNRILNYLKNENQIEIKTTNQYTEIKVINWEEYQEFSENGNPAETQRKPSGNPAETNKNDKNDKNEEKELFDISRKLYPGKKVGLDTEFKNFTKKHKDWKLIIPILKGSISNQIREREIKTKNNQWVPEWKNFSTWINGRCWEEEIKINETSPSNIQPGNILEKIKSKGDTF